MDFVMGQIAHHQREVTAGTPLDVAAAVRVSPVAHRFAPNHANTANPDRHRNVRPRRVNFNPDNAYDPNADTDDKREAEIDVCFDLTNPTINPQWGTRTISTALTYLRVGIPKNSDAIQALDPSRESNPRCCMGTILKLLGVA